MGVSWQASPTPKTDKMGESDEGPGSGEEGCGGGEVSSSSSKSLSKNNQVYSCILANVQSIGPNSTSGSAKRSELQSMCVKFNIDLIFITESWTSSSDD